MSSIDNDVQVIHRKNRLKEKVSVAGPNSGPGFLDPEHIKNAQKVIDEGADSYKEEIERTLKNLNTAWKALQSDEDIHSKSYQTKLNDIHRFTNHIKDLAATFKYELMDYFACSLRDFSEYIDTRSQEHIRIVDAHINVMMVVFHENIKDEGGEKAEELKAIVAKAIQKFSKSVAG